MAASTPPRGCPWLSRSREVQNHRQATCTSDLARGDGTYWPASGVGEDSLPSFHHIVQVHDHSGNPLIPQLRVPPVLQPICVRLCTKQNEITCLPDSWLMYCVKGEYTGAFPHCSDCSMSARSSAHR